MTSPTTAPVAAEQEPGAIDLSGLLALARRRWLIIAAVALACAVLAVAASATRTAVYASHVDIQLPGTDQSSDSGQRATIATELELAASAPVTEAAKVADGVTLAAAEVGTSYILRLTAQATSPEQALSAANQYGAAYLSIRQQRINAETARKTSVFKAQIDDLTAQLGAVDAAAAAQKPPGLTPVQAGRREGLISQLTQTTSTLGAILADGAAKGSAQTVAQADLPTAAVNGGKVPAAVAGIIIGLLLGFVGVVIIERTVVRAGAVSVGDTIADAPVLGRLRVDAGPTSRTARHLAGLSDATFVMFVGLAPAATSDLAVVVAAAGPVDRDALVIIDVADAVAVAGWKPITATQDLDIAGLDLRQDPWSKCIAVLLGPDAPVAATVATAISVTGATYIVLSAGDSRGALAAETVADVDASVVLVVDHRSRVRNVARLARTVRRSASVRGVVVR